ncbi:MAG TPA: molybdopterin cofactor-binding domain-containing protein [Terriglobales bacterium]|nr:molybdopterin cofactor-binding domain-containing protein [Terriglobales bacterium]
MTAYLDTNQASVSAPGFDAGRRRFMALGSGLFLFFLVEPLEVLRAQESRHMPGYPTDFNAYLRIGEDGRVTGFTGKIEMGQGICTSLAQLLAEELDVSVDQVDMVMGDTDLCPWDMGTFGSLSVRAFGPVLRGAGAEARMVLLQMAAEHLNAPVERLQVHSGVITDSGSKKTVSYADLVKGKRIERHLGKVPGKAFSAYSVIGHSTPRKDALEKVTGKAKYAGDKSVPGMLHARILRPPAHGATLKSVDTTAAERVAGVRIVKDGVLVAVLHEHRDVADQALQLIKAQYEPSSSRLDDQNIFDHLVKSAPEPKVVGQTGNLAEGEKLSTTVFEETYFDNYVAHAAMETHSALAHLQDGKMTVWAGTQLPFMLRDKIAGELGMSPDKVRVIPPYVGGGFGGKGTEGPFVEAAKVAKLCGKPVHMIWSREEEFFFDTFRPAAVIKIRAGVDAAGKLVLWDYAIYGGGDREARQFYAIPHERTLAAGGWMTTDPGLHPFAVGAWRAPSNNSNSFGRESHIDTIAAKLKIDPVQFRLDNLANPRFRRVLETAAEKFGWKPAPGPSGRGVGVAIGTDVDSFVATMAEVEVDKDTSRVRVKRVLCVQDMGIVVNPEGARQQMEGCMTMGMGYSLTEHIHFKNGEILDRNFSTYEIPRFSWLPKIETVLIDNPNNPPSGGGEPAIITMGAVIANAVFDAVGARVHQLPVTADRIKHALKKS